MGSDEGGDRRGDARRGAEASERSASGGGMGLGSETVPGGACGRVGRRRRLPARAPTARASWRHGSSQGQAAAGAARSGAPTG